MNTENNINIKQNHISLLIQHLDNSVVYLINLKKMQYTIIFEKL